MTSRGLSYEISDQVALLRLPQGFFCLLLFGNVGDKNKYPLDSPAFDVMRDIGDLIASMAFGILHPAHVSDLLSLEMGLRS